LVSFIYNIVILPLLSFAIFISKPFNKKLRQREKSWKPVLIDFNHKEKNRDTKRILFHASSMGEFEQAKPIIEKIKRLHKEYSIIVSFFSPSGFENQKKYKYADAILYMPFDRKAKVKYFINSINPDIVVFIRYEIWRNHLLYLKKKKIPVLLICATKPGRKLLYESRLFKSYTISTYNLFRKIYTVSKEHSEFFKELGIDSEINTLSDTRFDRIIENVESSPKNKILPDVLFSKDDFILVCGSTWEKDEELIIKVANRIEKEKMYRLRLIVVPHEPTSKHVKYIKEILPNSFLLSHVEDFLKRETDTKVIKAFLGKNHIVVDSIGKLLSLYVNADAAYVGGGFGVGVHSVTEPAGYGIPLVCGPRMDNSPDAVVLKSFGSLEVIKNEFELYTWLNKIKTKPDLRKKAGQINSEYIFKSKGSSNIIANDILELIK
jgi:3-deoxy-D-manno-octulosonic-acid transferase